MEFDILVKYNHLNWLVKRFQQAFSEYCILAMHAPYWHHYIIAGMLLYFGKSHATGISGISRKLRTSFLNIITFISQFYSILFKQEELIITNRHLTNLGILVRDGLY